MNREKINRTAVSNISIILFMIDTSSYAFFAGYFPMDSVIRSVWGLSFYIFLILAIIRIESIIRQIKKADAKNVFFILSITLIPAILIQFILPFHMAYYFKQSGINIILSIFFYGIWLFVISVVYIISRCYSLSNKADRRKTKKEINRESNDYYDAIQEYLGTGKERLKPKVVLVIANSLIAAFYIVLVLTMVLINVFCKNITLIAIAVVCIHITVLYLINIVKCKICRYKLSKALIECSLLTISLSIYLIFQWFIMPISFNLLLAMVTLGLLAYLINNNILLARTMMDEFSKINKENEDSN